MALDCQPAPGGALANAVLDDRANIAAATPGDPFSGFSGASVSGVAPDPFFRVPWQHAGENMADVLKRQA